MDREPVIVEHVFNEPVSQIWGAITDKDKMKQWYFDLPQFKAEVGCEFQFYGGPPEKQFLHLCEVTEVVPEKKLVHSWRYDGYSGDSFVTWELFDENGKTRVRLTHDKLYTFPESVSELAKQNFAKGWDHIVNTSLKDYLGK